MNITKREEDILESLYKEDGPLSTTELKSSTGIGTKAIGYSVREKLEPEGLVSYEYEESNGTEVRVHELTEEGESKIQRGLIGDVFGKSSESDPEKVALKAQVDEMEDRLEKVENKTQANKQILDGLQTRLDKAVEYIEKHDTRLNGLRWALEDSSLMLSIEEYVEKVRENSE
ncbi:hypothetical protein [Halolamina salifodinae]|uniref:DNA-binding PadR family transcriptional regulator n=1 Tax=Halolamina salifodinae TaxID=1202767 RepID=A0A8T4H0X0_9EURY|nr:hypothetical protein [Halolamina salifodinae]MBP1986978.1 DNA-binding PadR family transcriptional regulator [Halolamina salifodinae]